MLKFLSALLIFLTQYNHPLYDVSGYRADAQQLETQILAKTPLLDKTNLEEVLAVIFGKKELPLFIPDAEYLSPNPNEIVKLLTVAKSKEVYEAEVYDCDDYAYWFKAEMSRQWRKAGHKTPLAVCQVWAKLEITKTKEVVYHAFNGIMDSTGHMIWIEPQSNKVMNESRFKILKIYLLSF